MISYRIVPHTADLRIRVYGNTKEELFRNALKGMFEAMEPKSSDQPSLVRSISVKSTDINSLLVDFLSEALTLSDIHDEVYLDATPTQFADTSIEAQIHGRKIQGFGRGEIKAVTHHEVDIKNVGNRWETTIVFDV